MVTSGRDFLQAIDDIGLSLTQLKVLQLLAEGPGEHALKELTEHLALSLPAVSRAVDGLVQRDLIRRTEDAEDRRMKRVALTPKGTDLAADLVRLRFQGLDEFVAGLTAKQRAALDRALALICEREELR